MRLGLSLREVERRSLEIVAAHENSEFNISRAWLTDIEMGRFVPGSFKVVSLSEIYGLTIAQIHKFYGIQHGDIFGEWPVFRPPMMRRLALGKSLFGCIGAADWTMWPLLPPGTFVQIDPKQTRVKRGPIEKDVGQSQFARPIYFLDIRTGYACGWCEIKNGVLTLIPHPHSGQLTRTFRHPGEAEVVGRVTGVAMQITEENFTPIEERVRRSEPKK